MKIEQVNAEFLPGTTVDNAISDAVDFSMDHDNCLVKFMFNGVPFEITSKSDKNECSNQYLRICRAKVDGVKNDINK